jgi:hypothetical protein
VSQESSSRESWFNRWPSSDAEDDAGDGDGAQPVVEGSLGWSLGLGLVGGAIGGGAMILLAGEVARRMNSDVGVVRAIGGSVRFLGSDRFAAGLEVSIGIGAVLGLVFGVLMRHTVRLVARVLAGVLLAPVLWILVHAFVFKAFAPKLGALPLVPMLAGAAAYGLVIAVLRPPRTLRFED